MALRRPKPKKVRCLLGARLALATTAGALNSQSVSVSAPADLVLKCSFLQGVLPVLSCQGLGGLISPHVWLVPRSGRAGSSEGHRGRGFSYHGICVTEPRSNPGL